MAFVVLWPVAAGLGLGYVLAAQSGRWGIWPLVGFGVGLLAARYWAAYLDRTGLAERVAARLGLPREP